MAIKKSVILNYVLIIVFALNVLNFLIHISRTNSFNNIRYTLENDTLLADCNFKLAPRGGVSDSWIKHDVTVYDKVCNLTGNTYDGTFFNNGHYNVDIWNLRLNITEQCWINKAWCGEMEIHQFRNGKEKFQTIDLREIQKTVVTLDFILVGQDVLISLEPGDFIIYHPSEPINEYPISASNGRTPGAVTIGMIFYYYTDRNFKVPPHQIEFQLKKSPFQGFEPKLFFAILIIWFIVVLIKISTNIAYKRAQQETEKQMAIKRVKELEAFNEEISRINIQLENSNNAIRAISEIYDVLYSINLETGAFVKFRSVPAIEKFLNNYTDAEKALHHISYETFIAEDADKVADFFNVNTWNDRLNDRDTCSADFRSKNIGWVRTSLIVSQRNKNGDPILVFISIQDVQKDKQELAEALAIAEQANEIMKAYNETLNSDVARKTEHIRGIQNKVVLGLADVIGNRDESTGGHVKRTSDVIEIIVDEIRHQNTAEIDEQSANDIIRAAPMHDLGKIMIDSAILCKPARLTKEEFDIMKTHSSNSGKIVKLILEGVEEQHFVNTAFNVARYHHERWDGSGYPEGLAGEAIPIEARIMALADCYDALVSERCYKLPMSFEDAYDTICEGMGHQFDPALKPVFLACHEKLMDYYKSIK